MNEWLDFNEWLEKFYGIGSDDMTDEDYDYWHEQYEQRYLSQQND